MKFNIIENIIGINNKILILKSNQSNKKICIKFFKRSKSKAYKADLNILKKKTKFKKPILIKFNKKKLFIKMSYLIGHKITKFKSSYTNQLKNFLDEFFNFKKNLKAKEAIFDNLELKKQIKYKIALIKQKKNKNINKLIKNYDTQLNKINKKEKFRKIIFSPGDFGTQNIIVKKNNLFFFDFEHSGKDSIVKFLCDFLLHPQNMIINTKQKTVLIKKLLKSKTLDKTDIKLCINNIYFFHLRWSLIILNSFFKEEHSSLKTLIKKISLIRKNKILTINIKRQLYDNFIR